MPICFLSKDRKNMDADVGRWGGGGGRKTIIKIGWMKNTIFNKIKENCTSLRGERIKVISTMESKFKNKQHYY